jgi:hypothetical protein
MEILSHSISQRRVTSRSNTETEYAYRKNEPCSVAATAPFRHCLQTHKITALKICKIQYLKAKLH